MMRTFRVPLTPEGILIAAHIPARHWVWAGLSPWDPLIEREPLLRSHLIHLVQLADSLWERLPAGIPSDSPRVYFLNLLESNKPTTIEAVYRIYLVVQQESSVDKI